MSQVGRTRYFAWSATRVRSARRGEQKNKALRTVVIVTLTMTLFCVMKVKAKVNQMMTRDISRGARHERKTRDEEKRKIKLWEQWWHWQWPCFVWWKWKRKWIRWLQSFCNNTRRHINNKWPQSRTLVHKICWFRSLNRNSLQRYRLKEVGVIQELIVTNGLKVVVHDSSVMLINRKLRTRAALYNAGSWDRRKTVKTDSVQSSSNYLRKLFAKNLLTAR